MLWIHKQLKAWSKGLFSQGKEITEDVPPLPHSPVLPIIFIRDLRKKMSGGIIKTSDDAELHRMV